MDKWTKIACKAAEVQLGYTLASGQSFRWKECEDGLWRGVFHDIVLTIRQSSDSLFYKLHSDSKHDVEEMLKDYLHMEVSLVDLYSDWAKRDENFAKVSTKFPGVRMLRIDPVENVFSFICSSNNHISRISSMVEKLCTEYGEPLTEVDGTTYHSFPSVEALNHPSVESKLRELGFGYRAKFIYQTAKKMVDLGGRDWLMKLRDEEYREAHSQLLTLPGIGNKVADCICLMSLEKSCAIPVDTHVWQIAANTYMPELKSGKTLTNNLYWKIGDKFRDIFGEHAGWAHSVLFTADLGKFKESKQQPATKKRKKN